MTSSTTEIGTSFGPELLVELRGSRRRAQLEDRLRALVRDGTLGAGSRLPSSRSLAGDLEVSRRLVVDAYAQLLAEGYLMARRGGGTTSPRRRAPPSRPRARRRRGRCSSTSSRAPRSRSFPRALWSRALRDVLRSAPASAFAYPDVRGAASCESSSRPIFGVSVAL